MVAATFRRLIPVFFAGDNFLVSGRAWSAALTAVGVSWTIGT